MAGGNNSTLLRFLDALVQEEEEKAAPAGPVDAQTGSPVFDLRLGPQTTPLMPAYKEFPNNLSNPESVAIDMDRKREAYAIQQQSNARKMTESRAQFDAQTHAQQNRNETYGPVTDPNYVSQQELDQRRALIYQFQGHAPAPGTYTPIPNSAIQTATTMPTQSQAKGKVAWNAAMTHARSAVKRAEKDQHDAQRALLTGEASQAEVDEALANVRAAESRVIDLERRDPMPADRGGYGIDDITELLDQPRQHWNRLKGENLIDQVNGKEPRHGWLNSLPDLTGFKSWATDPNHPENALTIQQAATTGWTKAGQTFYGGEAVWEAYADTLSKGDRVLFDFSNDPTNWLIVPGKIGGGLKVFAEVLGLKGITRAGVVHTGTLLEGITKASELPDTFIFGALGTIYKMLHRPLHFSRATDKTLNQVATDAAANIVFEGQQANSITQSKKQAQAAAFNMWWNTPANPNSPGAPSAMPTPMNQSQGVGVAANINAPGQPSLSSPGVLLGQIHGPNAPARRYPATRIMPQMPVNPAGVPLPGNINAPGQPAPGGFGSLVPPATRRANQTPGTNLSPGGTPIPGHLTVRDSDGNILAVIPDGHEDLALVGPNDSVGPAYAADADAVRQQNAQATNQQALPGYVAVRDPAGTVVEIYDEGDEVLGMLSDGHVASPATHADAIALSREEDFGITPATPASPSQTTSVAQANAAPSTLLNSKLNPTLIPDHVAYIDRKTGKVVNAGHSRDSDMFLKYWNIGIWDRRPATFADYYELGLDDIAKAIEVQLKAYPDFAPPITEHLLRNRRTATAPGQQTTSVAQTTTQQPTTPVVPQANQAATRQGPIPTASQQQTTPVVSQGAAGSVVRSDDLKPNFNDADALGELVRTVAPNGERIATRGNLTFIEVDFEPTQLDLYEYDPLLEEYFPIPKGDRVLVTDFDEASYQKYGRPVVVVPVPLGKETNVQPRPKYLTPEERAAKRAKFEADRARQREIDLIKGARRVDSVEPPSPNYADDAVPTDDPADLLIESADGLTEPDLIMPTTPDIRPAPSPATLLDQKRARTEAAEPVTETPATPLRETDQAPVNVAEGEQLPSANQEPIEELIGIDVEPNVKPDPLADLPTKGQDGYERYVQVGEGMDGDTPIVTVVDREIGGGQEIELSRDFWESIVDDNVRSEFVDSPGVLPHTSVFSMPKEHATASYYNQGLTEGVDAYQMRQAIDEVRQVHAIELGPNPVRNTPEDRALSTVIRLRENARIQGLFRGFLGDKWLPVPSRRAPRTKNATPMTAVEEAVYTDVPIRPTLDAVLNPTNNPRMVKVVDRIEAYVINLRAVMADPTVDLMPLHRTLSKTRLDLPTNQIDELDPQTLAVEAAADIPVAQVVDTPVVQQVEAPVAPTVDAATAPTATPIVDTPETNWRQLFDGYVKQGTQSTFVRDLKKLGLKKKRIDEINRQIRQSHLDEAMERNPSLGKMTLGSDGVTVELTDFVRMKIKAAEPTMTRVMVGNHGIYVEFQQPANMGRFVKKRLQANEYSRNGVKLYDQTKSVNYADFKPGLWYVSVYDIPLGMEIPGWQKAVQQSSQARRTASREYDEAVTINKQIDEAESPVHGPAVPDTYRKPNPTYVPMGFLRVETPYAASRGTIRDVVLPGEVQPSVRLYMPQGSFAQDWQIHVRVPGTGKFVPLGGPEDPISIHRFMEDNKDFGDEVADQLRSAREHQLDTNWEYIPDVDFDNVNTMNNTGRSVEPTRRMKEELLFDEGVPYRIERHMIVQSREGYVPTLDGAFVPFSFMGVEDRIRLWRHKHNITGWQLQINTPDGWTNVGVTYDHDDVFQMASIPTGRGKGTPRERATLPERIADDLQDALNGKDIQLLHAGIDLGMIAQSITDFLDNLSHNYLRNQADKAALQANINVTAAPFMRNLPLAQSTRDTMDGRLRGFHGDNYGSRTSNLRIQPNDTNWQMLDKLLRREYGRGMGEVTPFEMMAIYPQVQSIIRRDMQVPDPKGFWKYMDLAAGIYSEITLLMPWSIPRQVIGNTLIGDMMQTSIAGQAAAITHQLHPKHVRNMVRYAIKGVDPLDTPVGAWFGRRGVGTFHPHLIGASILDAQTGGVGRSAIRRATDGVESRVASKLDNTRLGRFMGNTRWVGKPLKVIGEDAPHLVATTVEFGRNLVNGIQWATKTGLQRHFGGVYEATHLSRTLQEIASDLATRTGIVEGEIETALRLLGDGFDAGQVQDTLARLLTFHGIPAQQAPGLATDAAKRYATYANDLARWSSNETDKILFRYVESKADVWLHRAIPFHFYMSRAIPFYTHQLLRHPGYASAYYNAAQHYEKEAEANGWPEWMQKYTKVMNGPGGMFLAMTPLGMIGMIDMMIEAHGGYTDENTSFLGGWLEKVSSNTGIGLYPWFKFALSWTGYTGDSVMDLDPIGAGGVRKYLGMMAQMLVSTGILGDDLDRYLGKPLEQRLADVRTAWTNTGFIKALPGNRALPKKDVTKTPLIQQQNIALDIILESHDLTPLDWKRMQIAANLDPSSRSEAQKADVELHDQIWEEVNDQQTTDGPIWRQAVDDWVKSQATFAFGWPQLFSGQKTVQQTAHLGDRAAQDIAFGSKDALHQSFVDLFGREPTDEELEAFKSASINEARLKGIDPAARPVVLDNATHQQLGTEASRYLLNTSYSIIFGTIETTVIVDGVSYRPDTIQKMEPELRSLLADQWLAARDPNGTAAALKAERDEFEEAHPEFNEFRDWQTLKRKEWENYGGATGYRQRVSQENPGAAAFYAGEAEAIKAENPTWDAARVRKELDKRTFELDAYLAIFGYEVKYGEKSKGNSEDPTPRGYTPGATTSASGSQPISLSSVTKDLATYQEFMAQVNKALSEYYGRPIDYATSPPPWQAAFDTVLEQAGVTFPKGSDTAKDYLAWKAHQEGRGLNSSVAAYVQMVNTTGGDWQGVRKSVNMGGWSAVVNSGGQENTDSTMHTRPSGMGQGFTRNNDTQSVNSMGQHITVDNYSGGVNSLGQRITRGDGGGGGLNSMGQRVTRGG